MNNTETDSTLDGMTGLPNAHACRASLTAHTGRGTVSLGLVDLDWFGKVNGDRGRESGDAIIRAASDHVQSSINGVGETYRFGGDAIMVLLPKVSKEQAFLQLEEARRTFADAQEGLVTFSGGVAAAPDDGEDPETLIRKCSEALYRAKLTGRNRVCLAREEKMVTKTVHYRQGQLEGIARLAKREGMNEASLLREALDDLLRKYNA